MGRRRAPLAIGRVVVAATWLETVLDHVVRSLVDDGPVYTEMVSGQGVSQLCDLAVRLAAHVIDDPDPKRNLKKDLKTWTADIKSVAAQRNQLLHARRLGSEDDEPGRSLIIEVQSKRRLPTYEMTASVARLLGFAGRIDEVSAHGTELMGRLAAGYVGRERR